jgi:DNA-binding transcriptional LysR family regulator
MIDPIGVRSLVAIDAAGSVGAAAAALGYTPSAVSQQVKRLERELGVPLLERVGRGVLLTAHGKQVVDDGQLMLAQLERMQSQVHATGGEPRGPLRLAAFATAMRGVAAPLVSALTVTAREVSVTLVEKDPAEAVDLVAVGQADLAVVHNWVGVPLHLPSHLESEDIGTDVADLLVHREHRLAHRRRVTPADLIEERWACTPVGTICHEWFNHMFAGFASPPKVSYWSPEYATHIELVQQGVAVALVPRMGRGPLPGDVRSVPVAEPVPTRRIQAVWRATMANSPSIRLLRHQLRDLARAKPR